MGQKILAVEGNDDEHVLYQVANLYGLGTVEVKNCGGFEGLLSFVVTTLKGASDLDALAVLVDADDQPTSRWTQIRGSIPSLPDVPTRNGSVIQVGPIRFGVWMMPNNEDAGRLEDFLLGLIPSNDSMVEYANSFVGQIPAAERRFAVQFESKARLHAWLSVQEEPGKPYGVALKAGYFSPEPTRPFADWLQQVLS